MRSLFLGVALLGAALLGSGCGGSPRAPTNTGPGASQDETPDDAEAKQRREELARRRKDRKLDERVSVDNVKQRLSPYLDSIGAGLGRGASIGFCRWRRWGSRWCSKCSGPGAWRARLAMG